MFPLSPPPSLQKGEIHWERCERFLKQIAKYEQDMLSTMPPLHLEVLEQSLQSDNEEEGPCTPCAILSPLSRWRRRCVT
jgi:hypothetical protein